MRQRERQAGVTLVELVITMGLIGLLAGIASARFAGPSAFAARGFADATLAALGHARRVALAAGCDVRIQLDSAELRLSRWSQCQPNGHGNATQPLANPQGGSDYLQPVPDGLAVSAFDLYFDAWGRPHQRAGASPLTSDQAIDIGNQRLQLAAESGYAYRP
jgi:MSHA pilin protein MshC